MRIASTPCCASSTMNRGSWAASVGQVTSRPTGRPARRGPHKASVLAARRSRPSKNACASGRSQEFSPAIAANEARTACSAGTTRPSIRPSDERPSTIRSSCRDRRSCCLSAKYAARLLALGSNSSPTSGQPPRLAEIPAPTASSSRSTSASKVPTCGVSGCLGRRAMEDRTSRSRRHDDHLADGNRRPAGRYVRQRTPVRDLG